MQPSLITRSFFDPINLMIIGIALLITFLPFCIALAVNSVEDHASVQTSSQDTSAMLPQEDNKIAIAH